LSLFKQFTLDWIYFRKRRTTMVISRLAFLKRSLVLLVMMSLLLLPVSTASAKVSPSYEFATPIFGLEAYVKGNLLVADTGAGIVKYRDGKGQLLAALPGISDVAAGSNTIFAITGGGESDSAAKLFRMHKGALKEVADLGAFEAAYDPAGGEVDSNPFDVTVLSKGMALVADAGANDLLTIDRNGNIDWVAIFPSQLASTDHLKSLAGCPTPPPGFEFICELPDAIPAESVPTSVAIGPDGAYYVGELVGFPAPTGMSRVWRIEPGTLNADCATSPACSVVAEGFTSIVDLAFGPDGTLYVVEMDEATWAAVEFGVGAVGGTVNACDSSTWTCSEFATQLPIPMAVAVDGSGKVFAAINALIPGQAQIVELP
jgi:hypothetical protein